MYAGKMVEVGDVYKIFENPSHPYTKLLMKALPRITKNQGRLETIPGMYPNLAKPPTGCRFHPRCPFAIDVCSKSQPEFIEIEEGHLCASIGGNSKMSKILSIDNVKKIFHLSKGIINKRVYHVKAVDGISFDINRGEKQLVL